MKKYIETLKTVSLFKDIKEPDLQPLLVCLSPKLAQYEKNDIVFMSGDSINSFGVVLSGQVQIVLEDYYGNRSILAQIGKRNLFGESFAFAENESLPVFVIAAAESKLLFLDCRRLASPCANSCAYHRQLIQNMLKILALKNISLTQKVELVSKKTIREKLLAYLSAEAQKAGKSSFSIPFDRQGLADYLSVDRSAMSAVLSKLRNEGIINFNKNKFELLKQQKNLPSKNNI
jgi:CRP-like cAMP-binding protein